MLVELVEGVVRDTEMKKVIKMSYYFNIAVDIFTFDCIRVHMKEITF